MGVITDTKQVEFATSMLMRMQEEKGSKILDFTEKATVTGANTYTFYRFGESEVGGNDIDMYRSAYVGNAGTAEKKVATIEYVYASDKIKAAEVNSTSLDLKSSFVDSLMYAMKRNVDKILFGEVEKLTFADKYTAGQGLKFGDQALALDDEKNINALVEAAVYAATLAKETTVSERPSVALVVTAREFAILHRAEKITNTNYATISKFQTNTLFGCEVIKIAEGIKTTAKKHCIYLIPQGTIGSASWENDVEAKAWWDDAQDSLFCRAKRSLGVVVLEPESIMQVVYKDPTAAAPYEAKAKVSK
ncbi:MAG: phage capsid protein [Cetobacterium sp.]|uniref:phage capsid protein n=1 Tax=Cetobacterium sp. TaxID=2071632 RepID=UPI003EE75397